MKVQCCGIRHGEFNAEATAILDEEKPGIDMSRRSSKGDRRRFRDHQPLCLALSKVSFGTIIRVLEAIIGHGEQHKTRDDHDGSPGAIRSIVEFNLDFVVVNKNVFGLAKAFATVNDFEEREQEGSDDNLGDSSTKISPASD